MYLRLSEARAMEWGAPPEAAVPDGKFSAARAELRSRPGEWGVIARGKKNPIGRGTKTCWGGFELRHVRDPEDHSYTIYGRYVGEPAPEYETDIEAVAMVLHKDAHPGADMFLCRCRDAARIAVEVLTPRIVTRTRDEGWVPFGTHAIFDRVPPLVLSEMSDPDGLPRWERIDHERLDAYLEPAQTRFVDAEPVLEELMADPEIRDLAQQERDRMALADAGPLKHVAGNAEDCPVCRDLRSPNSRALPYPWICPGEPEEPLDLDGPGTGSQIVEAVPVTPKKLAAIFSVRLSYEEVEAAEKARHPGETVSAYLRRLIQEDS